MPSEIFREMPFPAKGLDITMPYSQQPKLTTPQGINVRLNESLTTRARGGQRCGIRKYLNATVPGVIQELNTVITLDDLHLGGTNYQDGDAKWNVIDHAGTYVLVKAGGSWSISGILGIDMMGNQFPGMPIQGVPVGGDANDTWRLPSFLILPAGMTILAYWQPGAFPITRTDWNQNHGLFPGFGWAAAKYPSGSQQTFGYQSLPSWFIPSGSIPSTPFWNWPSGFANGVDCVYRRSSIIKIPVVVSPVSPGPGDPYPVSFSIKIILSLNANQPVTSSTAAGGFPNTSPGQSLSKTIGVANDPRPPQASGLQQVSQGLWRPANRGATNRVAATVLGSWTGWAKTGVLSTGTGHLIASWGGINIQYTLEADQAVSFLDDSWISSLLGSVSGSFTSPTPTGSLDAPANTVVAIGGSFTDSLTLDFAG